MAVQTSLSLYRLLLVYSLFLIALNQCHCFTVSTRTASVVVSSSSSSSRRRPFSSLSSPIYKVKVDVAEDEASSTASVVVDGNGKQFTENGVVRVVAKGLKAFQVSPKGRGSYVDNEFKADEKLPYLALVPGLQGVVTKVYDVDQVSANFPIQVKFTPGENNEDLDVPVPFIMHFLPEEVECV